MIVIQNDEAAHRENEIPAIFNPKRVRTPSVVVTGSPNNGPSQLGNLNQIIHSDSITSSQPDGAESLTGVIIGDHSDHHSHHQFNSLTQIHPNQLPRSVSDEHEHKQRGCRKSCCSELAQKVSLFWHFPKMILNIFRYRCTWECVWQYWSHSSGSERRTASNSSSYHPQNSITH